MENIKSPFDILKSISFTKENLSEIDNFEKYYNSFLINRGLSYYKDTVLIVNEINMLPDLPIDMKYQFLINIIKSRKRFSKWFKRNNSEEIILVSKYYKVNYKRAAEILSLMSNQQIVELKDTEAMEGKYEKL